MFDHLKIYNPSIMKFQKDMGVLNRSLVPPGLAELQRLSRNLDPMIKHQIEIGKAFENSGLTASISSMAKATQHLQRIAIEPPQVPQIAARTPIAHNTWIESLVPIAATDKLLPLLQTSAKFALFNSAIRLNSSTKLLAGIEYARWGKLYKFDRPLFSYLETAVSRTLESYSGLANSVNRISDITGLPSFVIPGATREIYTTSWVLETLRPQALQEESLLKTDSPISTAVEEEVTSCIDLLQNLNPKLIKPYLGAKEALQSNNTDRVRQVLSCLRELWNHLIRKLAPNDLVIAYVPNLSSQSGLLHEGKPTRRARLLYICREINNDPLSDFINEDAKALLELYNIFNRIHELDIEMSNEQLRAIVVRTESWITYLLQISGY